MQRLLESSLTGLASISINLVRALKYILRCRVDKRELITHSSRIIFDSFSPIVLSTFTMGIVMAIQLAPEFASRGITSKLGILSAITLFRELAPVLGCLMLATQYGAGIAAEIANMKVTEQVDALKILKVDPVYYLLVPRMLAAMLCAPVVIFISVIIGIHSAFATTWLLEGASYTSFMGTIQSYLAFKDVFICLFKSSVFGGLIVLIAANMGLETSGGAKEVGETTTLTVIFCFLSIIILDYIITSIYL